MYVVVNPCGAEMVLSQMSCQPGGNGQDEAPRCGSLHSRPKGKATSYRESWYRPPPLIPATITRRTTITLLSVENGSLGRKKKTAHVTKPTSPLRRPHRSRIAQLLERRALGQSERPQPRHARQREAQRVEHALTFFFSGGQRSGLRSYKGATRWGGGGQEPLRNVSLVHGACADHPAGNASQTKVEATTRAVPS